jgi:HEAT repeat protein
VAGPAREPEREDPPFAPAPIEELLRLVVKAARAQQLYLPNNPVYQSAVDAARAAFAPIWRECAELTLTVTETELQWYGVPVHGDGTKSSDNLPWLFFKDGLRELKLLPGFEQDELVKFLDVLKRARKAAADEDDLVTMLWEADFAQLVYRYVELLGEGGGEGLADGSEMQPASPDQVRAGLHAPATESSQPSGVVNMADFDSTLYFLDPGEIEYLQDEIALEYKTDLRGKVVCSLLDIFEQQPDPTVRHEVLENLGTILVYLLTSGDFRGVADLLREAQLAAGRAVEVTAEQKRELAQLPDRLSAPEALSQLLHALDETPTLPAAEDLALLFDELRPAALGTVFHWLARSRNERLRPMLGAAAERLASANTAELVRLIQAPDPEVALEAIRRAGTLKTQAAVLALGKVIAEGDLPRRQAAVQALTEIGSAGALQALERAIEDADRDVRITAVRALSARAYRPVTQRLEGIVKGRSIRDADTTEKKEFFEAYGVLAGDAAVPYLDSLLNGKGFLGRREDPEIRACAAFGLGRVASARARDALQKSNDEREIVVRNAVARALRGSGQ